MGPVRPTLSRHDEDRLGGEVSRPNFPSMVKASLFQPWSTRLLSTGTLMTGPAAEGTAMGPRSTSLSLAVRT